MASGQLKSLPLAQPFWKSAEQLADGQLDSTALGAVMRAVVWTWHAPTMFMWNILLNESSLDLMVNSLLGQDVSGHYLAACVRTVGLILCMRYGILSVVRVADHTKLFVAM